MQISKLRLEGKARKEGMETPERVATWLEEMDIQDARDRVGSLDDGTGLIKDKADDNGEPATPLRPATKLTVDEISPTDTAFSSTSVFDPPVRRECQRTGSPSPRCTEECSDDGSDLTSIAGDEVSANPKEEPSYHGAKVVERPYTQQQRPCPQHPVVLDSSLTSQSSPSNPLTQPRLIWLTSCLQCTLARLPCTRTRPACSRCMRHGQGSVCLVQRRIFFSEVSSRDSDSASAHNAVVHSNWHDPVLLRLATDGPDAWQRKKELANALLAEWRRRQETRNWVLPDVHRDVRRGFVQREVNARGAFGGGHPGEGVGPVVWVRVGEEDGEGDGEKLK